MGQRTPDGFMKILRTLKIKPKMGGIIDFVQNAHQAAFTDRIIANRLAGMPTREIHVKDRQVGDTTGTAAFMYADANTNEATECLVVTNIKETAEKVWKIYDRFIKYHAYDRGLQKYKDDEKDEARKRPRYHSKKNWTHQSNDSSISIELESDEAARGGSALHFHGSEADFWDDFADAHDAIMAQVPDDPYSVAVYETTFDGGRSAEFREFVKDSLDGKTGWLVVFVGYLEHEEYTLPFANGKKRDQFVRTMDSEERKLLKERNVPLEKLHWRRRTIMTKFRGKPERFKRAFPIDVWEALRFKGESYFSAEAVNEYTQMTCHRQREVFPVMDPVTDKYRIMLAEDFPSLEEMDPRLYVWEEPRLGAKYVIGADIADSEENTLVGKAKSVAVIGNADTGQVVAVWIGKIDPEEFAAVCRATGLWYNKALICPERNNHGHVVINYLKRKNYPHIYATQKMTQRENGEVVHTPRLGFDTQAGSRQILLRNLQTYINSIKLHIPDERIITQMMSFIDRKGAGQPRKKYKGQDDAVIALALFVWACYRREHWARRAGPDAYLEMERIEHAMLMRQPLSAIEEIKKRAREQDLKERRENARGKRGGLARRRGPRLDRKKLGRRKTRAA